MKASHLSTVIANELDAEAYWADGLYGKGSMVPTIVKPILTTFCSHYFQRTSSFETRQLHFSTLLHVRIIKRKILYISSVFTFHSPNFQNLNFVIATVFFLIIPPLRFVACCRVERIRSSRRSYTDTERNVSFFIKISFKY